MHWTGFFSRFDLWSLVPAALVLAVAAVYNRLAE